MPSKPIKRVSAFTSDYIRGRFATDGKIGVIFQEVPDLNLWQIAAWHDSLDKISLKTAEAIGIEMAPGPGRASIQGNQVLLRVEPLKFWFTGDTAPQISPRNGTILDLSHSRSHLRVSGPQAEILLNRYLPLDLRIQSFVPGAVATTAFHHVAITLWRAPSGFELFLPRSFALSLWELLRQGAAQFGYEVA